MYKIMTPSILLFGLLGIASAAQVILANRAATRDFGPQICWLKQGRDVVNIRELEFATTGYFIPNPLMLFNRRFIGMGMEDPAVFSPHFAVYAAGENGEFKVWGWSFRRSAFWRDENGTIDKFVSTDVREACEMMIAQN